MGPDRGLAARQFLGAKVEKEGVSSLKHPGSARDHGRVYPFRSSVHHGGHTYREMLLCFFHLCERSVSGPVYRYRAQVSVMHVVTEFVTTD